MPLASGEKLGRLGRDVAIKVSAEHFSERMEREARTIASISQWSS
jgi:hypothetical protein